MEHIAARELRNNTAGAIRRVQGGETLVVTVKGKPTVQLGPLVTTRRHWISRDDLVGRLRNAQADAGLRDDLARVAGETTDDLDPIR